MTPNFNSAALHWSRDAACGGEEFLRREIVAAAPGIGEMEDDRLAGFQTDGFWFEMEAGQLHVDREDSSLLSRSYGWKGEDKRE
jgi:hypothetical protein